ncbi:MAG: pyridoxal 5'-phosphate synthase, partial [Pseudomonadota bacterium]
MTDSIPGSPTATDYLSDDTPRDLDWIDAADPIALFDGWLASAGATEPNDPNAMSLATVDADGQPDVRIVLLKGLSDKGFAFYTNSESAKGRQLGAVPRAALCFHWKTQRRQVRVRGHVEEVGADDSDAYFANRARGSRLSAWAS